MDQSIYVITNHKDIEKPIDERFLKSEKNYIFYLVNKIVPNALKDKKYLLEYGSRSIVI